MDLLALFIVVCMEIRFEWEPVAGADHYRVYVSDSPYRWGHEWIAATTETEIEIELPDEGLHYAQVVAVLHDGTESVWGPGERVCP